MAGEEHQDVKQERVALPPPAKRRDLHLRRLLDLYLRNSFFSFSFN
jgi:hypothetical protein